MSQQQHLDLLRRVASTSNYSRLDKFLPQLKQLNKWAEGEFDNDRLAKHISDTELIRHAFDAASNSIKKMSDACKGLYTLLPAIPGCVVELLYVCDLCLPEKCLKGNLALCKRVRAQIVQTDFLHTFAGLSSAIADAVTQHILSGHTCGGQYTTASSHKPSSSSRRRSKTNRTAATEPKDPVAAAMCLAQLLTGLWISLRAVWGTSGALPRPLDDETFPVIAFDSDFRPTIAPISALSLALLRHTSSNNGASDDFMSWDFAPRALNIMRSISLVLYMEIHRARGDGGPWEAEVPDPETAGVKEMLQSQQLQELLIYSLAINLQLSQEQQQGLTAVPSMEPATADAGGVSSSSVAAARPQASRKRKSSSALQQESQPVEDHTARVLLLLGLSDISLEQYKEYKHSTTGDKLDQKLALEAAVSNLDQALRQSDSLPAPWQHPQQASSSRGSSNDHAVALHIAVLKLLLQYALLRHSQRGVYDSIRCMEAVILTLIESYHSRIEARATPAGSTAAAVAQSFLAPLVLQLGPAVLHVQKQEEEEEGLKEDLLYEYGFIWRAMLKAGLTTDAETQQQQWADIFNQAPFTACAAVELAMREAARGGCSDKVARFVVEHVGYIIQAASQNDKLLEAVFEAQQHGGLDPKSLGSQPFSLLASAVKYCDVFTEGPHDCFQALELAVAATEAAQQFASKAGGSAAAAPWLHLAAKALACCGKALLWPLTKGTAEDQQAWLGLELIAKKVLLKDYYMATDDEAESAAESAESDSDLAESAGRAEFNSAEVVGRRVADASSSPGDDVISAGNSAGSPSNTDSSDDDSDEYGAVSFFGNPFEGRETCHLSVLLRKIAAAVSWCNQHQPFLASSSSTNSNADQASAAAMASTPDAGAGELMPSVHAAQQLQKLLIAAAQHWEGGVGEWWGPEENSKTYPCWDMFVAARKAVGYQLALQLQQFGLDSCAAAPTVLCCNNPGCANMGESGHLFVSELACVGKSKCSKCKAAGYCSRACQVQHWKQHKKLCGVLCQD